MKNVVLTPATNVRDHPALHRFIKSFRKFNKTDDVVLLTDNSTQPLQHFFKEYDIQTILFNYPYPTISNAKYFGVLDFLKSNQQYQNIFICDSRDLVFQGNVFEDLPLNDFLYVFTEDNGFPISKQIVNVNWILHVYGNTILQKIQHNLILNAGTYLGSKQYITQTFELIISEMRRTGKTEYDYQILDQAILNYISVETSSELFPHERKLNGDIVATVGLTVTYQHYNMSKTDVDEVIVENDTMYLNGKLPKVVHQYDRSPTLTQLFTKLYN